jgi:hypothetical protein
MVRSFRIGVGNPSGGVGLIIDHIHVRRTRDTALEIGSSSVRGGKWEFKDNLGASLVSDNSEIEIDELDIE